MAHEFNGASNEIFPSLMKNIKKRLLENRFWRLAPARGIGWCRAKPDQAGSESRKFGGEIQLDQWNKIVIWE